MNELLVIEPSSMFMQAAMDEVLHLPDLLHRKCQQRMYKYLYTDNFLDFVFFSFLLISIGTKVLLRAAFNQGEA